VETVINTFALETAYRHCVLRLW